MCFGMATSQVQDTNQQQQGTSASAQQNQSSSQQQQQTAQQQQQQQQGAQQNVSTATPSAFVQQAGQNVFGFGSNLAGSPFNAPLQNIVGFNPTQTSSFAAINDIASAPNANNPFYNAVSNDFSAYGGAPASHISAPSVLGNFNAANATLTDYFDPNLQLELNPTLAEITRQADIAKNGPGGVGSAATAAGAYGDARHGIENANVDEAAMRQAAQATAGAYQNAFTNAANLRGIDVSNLINTQGTNANLNEQALQRVLGAGGALQSLAQQQTGTGINLAQANLNAGNQQQQIVQQGANAVYNQQLQDVLAPYQYQLPGLTSSLAGLIPTQPTSTTSSGTSAGTAFGTNVGNTFGSTTGASSGTSFGDTSGTSSGTTTTQQPNNALWNLLGAVLGSAAQGYGKSFSDERLKIGMEEIGRTNDGLPLYVYRYVPEIDPTGTPRIGLSAQEVEKAYPEAVSEIAGFKAVDYERATRFARVLGLANSE
jgi:hypothetical protein